MRESHQDTFTVIHIYVLREQSLHTYRHITSLTFAYTLRNRIFK